MNVGKDLQHLTIELLLRIAAERHEFVLLKAKEYLFLHDHRKKLVVEPNESMSCWQRPPMGWVKLNSDGAFIKGETLVGAGGILRDHNGAFLQAFVAKARGSSMYKAELLGLLQGLAVARQMKIVNLEVEIDALEVLKVVCADEPENSLHKMLINECRELLLSRDWRVRIRHIARSGNQAADWLAAYGGCCDGDFIRFNDPPEGLKTIMEIDVFMSRHM